jgi:flagellar biosynthesis/type III secretory pathway chaperone
MESLQGIIQILDQLVQHHERLLEIEVEKHTILLGSNPEGLIPLLHKQSKLLKTIDYWEAERKAAIDRYLLTSGIVADAFTISDLVKLVTDTPMKESLETYRNSLYKLIAEISTKNQVNQQLIEQSMSFVDLTLQLITEQPDRDVIYSGKNQLQKTGSQGGRSFFDAKA